MKLAAWMDSNNITDARFGEAIGVARQAVHRYRTGERIPDKALMKRINEATGGEVSPNDFYDLESATPSMNGGAS